MDLCSVLMIALKGYKLTIGINKMVYFHRDDKLWSKMKNKTAAPSKFFRLLHKHPQYSWLKTFFAIRIFWNVCFLHIFKFTINLFLIYCRISSYKTQINYFIAFILIYWKNVLYCISLLHRLRQATIFDQDFKTKRQTFVILTHLTAS